MGESAATAWYFLRSDCKLLSLNEHAFPIFYDHGPVDQARKEISCHCNLNRKIEDAC